MFKRITEKDEGPFEGYVYLNNDGYDEYVEVSSSAAVKIVTYCGGNAVIYTEDIPKLIKALQMAYNYQEGV